MRQRAGHVTRIRQQVVEEATFAASGVFLDGGDLGKTKSQPKCETKTESIVTGVFLSKVKPGMDDAFRAWSVRIQQALAQYPGYRGMYIQPPTTAEGRWTTLVRYDTAENLKAWMAAPEREVLLSKSKAFIEYEDQTRLATSFPGWVSVDWPTGTVPPNWKVALLVLLGLFPIAMLAVIFLSPMLKSLPQHFSVAAFIGVAVALFATCFAAMPFFVPRFAWWLFPNPNSAATRRKGIALLCLLYAIEVALFWQMAG